MKKSYILLIILLSFNFSYQFTTMPYKFTSALKCFFDTTENINTLSKLIEAVWTKEKLFEILGPVFGFADIAQTCLGINIIDIIREFIPIPSFLNSEINKGIILNQIHKANAPILLRKYLYDTAVKSDIFKAKKECKEMTKMTPYDKYKNICDLFELK